MGFPRDLRNPRSPIPDRLPANSYPVEALSTFAQEHARVQACVGRCPNPLGGGRAVYPPPPWIFVQWHGGKEAERGVRGPPPPSPSERGSNTPLPLREGVQDPHSPIPPSHTSLPRVSRRRRALAMQSLASPCPAAAAPLSPPWVG